MKPNRLPRRALAIVLIVWVALSGTARAQQAEDITVALANAVLDEVMAIPARQIPQALLREAEGVAIIPNVVKGGFVVGLRHGRGVLLIKDAAGNWLPPSFVSLTGGSVGWQAGIQSTDVVLVFRTRRSVDNLTAGTLTIGVDAAAAAGPVGRAATAATDATLSAEIYSYSRSRGLFAGVSLDGSALQFDPQATGIYYRGTATNAPSTWPASAVHLIQRLNHYAGRIVAAPAAAPLAAPLAAPPASATDTARGELIAAWQQLAPLLDPQWTKFLALPAEAFRDGQPVPVDALQASLRQYEMIVPDPRYDSLVRRPEFAATYRALRQYLMLSARGAAGAAAARPESPAAGAAGVESPRP